MIRIIESNGQERSAYLAGFLLLLFARLARSSWPEDT